MSAQLSVKVDPAFKKVAEEISANIGLDISDVLRVLLKKFVDRRGFPFEVVEDYDYNPPYNKETLKAMEEAKAGVSCREVSMEEFKKMLKLK
jgi:addiction module RelB/DinJ family antitoxin